MIFSRQDIANCSDDFILSQVRYYNQHFGFFFPERDLRLMRQIRGVYEQEACARGLMN
jgi:hypothetical protein